MGKRTHRPPSPTPSVQSQAAHRGNGGGTPRLSRGARRNTATQRVYDALRYARWRWFWDYGGGTLTDLFSHWIDTIHWILDVDTPLSAQAMGERYAHDQFECPDTMRATFPYPKKFQVGYDSSIVYGYEDGGMIFRGSNATLRLDRSRYELFTEESVKEQRTSHPHPP